jgi:hypothetical protein
VLLIYNNIIATNSRQQIQDNKFKTTNSRQQIIKRTSTRSQEIEWQEIEQKEE